MVTVTWKDGEKPAEVITISDEVLASLEQFRLSSHFIVGGVAGHMHDSVKRMLLTSVVEIIVKPALEMFPPPGIAALKVQAKAAQKAIADAHAGILAGSGIRGN